MEEACVPEQWNKVGEILFRYLPACRNFLQGQRLPARMNGKAEYETDGMPSFG
jgi:hypothetical protein